jgi:hypothetical protein
MITIVLLFLFFGLYIRVSKKFPTLSGQLITDNRAVWLGWLFIINSIATYALSYFFYSYFFYSNYPWYEAYVSSWYLLTFSPSILIAIYFVLFTKNSAGQNTVQPVNSIPTEQHSTKKFGRQLIIYWVISTLVYSALILMSGGSTGGTLTGYIAGFIGLFVPVGPYSIMMVSTPMGFTANILSVAIIIFVSLWGNKYDILMKSYRKIVMILLILFVVTVIADAVRGTPFASFTIFLNGGIDVHF